MRREGKEFRAARAADPRRALVPQGRFLKCGELSGSAFYDSRGESRLLTHSTKVNLFCYFSANLKVPSRILLRAQEQILMIWGGKVPC